MEVCLAPSSEIWSWKEAAKGMTQQLKGGQQLNNNNNNDNNNQNDTTTKQNKRL